MHAKCQISEETGCYITQISWKLTKKHSWLPHFKQRWWCYGTIFPQVRVNNEGLKNQSTSLSIFLQYNYSSHSIFVKTINSALYCLLSILTSAGLRSGELIHFAPMWITTESDSRLHVGWVCLFSSLIWEVFLCSTTVFPSCQQINIIIIIVTFIITTIIWNIIFIRKHTR